MIFFFFIEKFDSKFLKDAEEYSKLSQTKSKLYKMSKIVVVS